MEERYEAQASVASTVAPFGATATETADRSAADADPLTALTDMMASVSGLCLLVKSGRIGGSPPLLGANGMEMASVERIQIDRWLCGGRVSEPPTLQASSCMSPVALETLALISRARRAIRTFVLAHADGSWNEAAWRDGVARIGQDALETMRRSGGVEVDALIQTMIPLERPIAAALGNACNVGRSAGGVSRTFSLFVASRALIEAAQQSYGDARSQRMLLEGVAPRRNNARRGMRR